ncbi:MAG: hypothetical protein WEB88_05725 [Gemmatimonadota bacterium]
MRAFAPLALFLAAGVAGCATLGLGGPSEEEASLEAGLAALAAGDYRTAHEHLEWTARTHPDEVEGQRALLALAAAELDPRNPARRLWATADLAERYLELPEAPGWTRPLAESLFLVAAELGAAEESAVAAESENRRLRFEGSTVPDRLRDAASARDAALVERNELQTRLDSMERVVSIRNDSITALNKELERIRKLIKP